MIDQKKRYKYLLFDLDNTILDFNANSKKAFTALLNAVKVRQEDHFYALYKEINKHVWWQLEKQIIVQSEVRYKRFEHFFKVIGVDCDPHRANEIYFEYLVRDPNFVPGAINLIEKLSQNYTLIVITNGMKEVQNQRLNNSGIRGYFKHIVISDEINFAKPDPRFFKHVLDLNDDHQKENYLVIGDTIGSDILGGNKFGIDTCWFNPLGVINDSDIQPKISIHALDQLLDFL